MQFLLNLYSTIRDILSNIFKQFLMPDFCALCNQFLRDEILLCSFCFKKVQPVTTKRVLIDKKRSFLIHALSFYHYEFKPLIYAKFYNNRALCQELGMLTYNNTTLRASDFDIIVPIPLHWTRYAWRGFNQAEEMAKAISKQSNKPIIHFLKRVRRTNYQSSLNKKERSLNLQAAFEIALSVSDYNKYKNLRILLVDDLYTTGSTIQEAIKTLDVKTDIHVLVAFRS